MELMLFSTVIFFVLGAIMVSAAHSVANWRMARHHPELSTNPEKLWSSTAFVTRRMGLYGAFLIATFAVAQNIGNAVVNADSIAGGLTSGLMLESALGLLSIFAFIFTALRSVDWLILSKVDNDTQVANNNHAVGLTEGAILLGTGFVAYGSLLGEGHITSSWVFFLIGQVVFVAFSYLMEYVIHPEHNAKTEIEKGCVASGVIVSTMLLVVAMFVKNGVAGDFYGYAQDIPYFLKMFGLQLFLFLTYMSLIEPILLKVMKIKSTALNGAMVRAAMQLTIAGSIVYNVSL